MESIGASERVTALQPIGPHLVDRVVRMQDESTSKCSLCVPNESDLSMKHLRTMRARLQQMRYYFPRIVSATHRVLTRCLFPLWVFTETCSNSCKILRWTNCLFNGTLGKSRNSLARSFLRRKRYSLTHII